jgi:hypothetical protein
MSARKQHQTSRQEARADRAQRKREKREQRRAAFKSTKPSAAR